MNQEIAQQLRAGQAVRLMRVVSRTVDGGQKHRIKRTPENGEIGIWHGVRCIVSDTQHEFWGDPDDLYERIHYTVTPVQERKE